MTHKIEWNEGITHLWTIKGIPSEVCYITRIGFGEYQLFLDDEAGLIYPSLQSAMEYAERNVKL